MPGQIKQDSFAEARANIRADSKLDLSLDYVEFGDGSSWGKDSQLQSEYILGMSEGQRIALKQINDFLVQQNKDAIFKLLQQQITETNPPIINKEKSDKWQNGFINGYRTVLMKLQIAYEKQGKEGVFLKLKDVEKNIKMDEQK